MKEASAYDAWKNFILVVSGVLAGGMFSSFDDQKSFAGMTITAVHALLDFDKTVPVKLAGVDKGTLIALVTVFYFIKCLHGVLVGIYSEHYKKDAQHSVARAMGFIALVTWTVVSLMVAPHVALLTVTSTSATGAGLALLSVAYVPLFVITSFDLYRWSSRSARLPLHRIFAKEKSYDEFLGTWIIEDLMSLGLILIWLVVVLLPVTDAVRINATLIVVVLYMLLNSIFDYVANRAFFFDFTVAAPRQNRPSAEAQPVQVGGQKR